MRILILLVLAVTLSACGSDNSESKENKVVHAEENKQGIDGLEITYERAFNHNHNGLTVMMDVTNNTGYDVQINEVKQLKSNQSGFELHHENSYSLNGDILKNGETKKNETLLYFHEENYGPRAEWVIPEFEVMMNNKKFNITGKKMIIE